MPSLAAARARPLTASLTATNHTPTTTIHHPRQAHALAARTKLMMEVPLRRFPGPAPGWWVAVELPLEALYQAMECRRQGPLVAGPAATRHPLLEAGAQPHLADSRGVHLQAGGRDRSRPTPGHKAGHPCPRAAAALARAATPCHRAAGRMLAPDRPRPTRELPAAGPMAALTPSPAAARPSPAAVALVAAEPQP
jgi:hypothetical protein